MRIFLSPLKSPKTVPSQPTTLAPASTLLLSPQLTFAFSGVPQKWKQAIVHFLFGLVLLLVDPQDQADKLATEQPPLR